jgi:Flp pilus assembly protein TadB
MKKLPKNPWLQKLEEGMRQAGLSPKREFALLAIIDLLFIALGVYLYVAEKQLMSALGMVLLIVFADYFLLSKAKRLQKAKNEALENEFVRLFSYCSIYLRDGLPVYHALEEVIRYATPEMQDKLRTLLHGIDQDKSVTPYIEFSAGFAALEIRQVMISLFKIADDGGGEAYLRQFAILFESLANDKRKNELAKTESTLNNLCMLPLIDSAMSMILITVGVVIVIGGLVNGL